MNITSCFPCSTLAVTMATMYSCSDLSNQGHIEFSRPATYKIYGNENRLIW